MGTLIFFIGFGIIAILAITIVISLLFRVVVPTNEVHIIQTKKSAKPFGEGYAAGNIYFNFPGWIPFVGISRTVLSVAIFDIKLEDYQAYDKYKVPFMVDINAFFRINDAPMAAQRVDNMNELLNQLQEMIKGVIRKTLSTDPISDIMVERGRYGLEFINELGEQLKEWGVDIKSIELMDIRDTFDGNVIEDIQNKRKSVISKDSRVEVAENLKLAEIKEIETKREADVAREQAMREVGIAVAQKEKDVKISQEEMKQAVAVSQKLTVQKDLEVEKLREIEQANIIKAKNIVKAEEEKEKERINAEAQQQKIQINAEAEKNRIIAVAEGEKESEIKRGEGIAAVGEAEASAKKAIEMARVEPQITLAKEIGTNANYMQYLLGTEGIKAGEAVGIKNAEALESADLKVIANAGTPDDGVKSLSNLFSSKGGTSLGSMLEALKNTEAGRELFEKYTGIKSSDNSLKNEVKIVKSDENQDLNDNVVFEETK